LVCFDELMEPVSVDPGLDWKNSLLQITSITTVNALHTHPHASC
jgi:hypothetical protein